GAKPVALPRDLPMPYTVLQQLPFVALGRAPARFAAPASLCVALLAAFGVVALGERLRRVGWTALAGAALVGVELLAVPLPLSEPPASPLYAWLAARPCRGPLFELAIDTSAYRYWDKRRLYFQTQHGCPISGGFIARNLVLTPEQEAWLSYAHHTKPSPALANAMRTRLLEAGFTDVVIARDAYADKRHYRRDRDVARALVGVPPAYDGPDGVVIPLR